MVVRKIMLDVVTKLRQNDFEKPYDEIRLIKNKDDLSTFQKKYLEKLLLHANFNVPYYNKIFDNVGIVRNGKVDISKFEEIPILTKKLMRKHYQELISNDYNTRKWYYNSSGGSTGEPTRFIQDNIYSKWGNAAIDYYYQDMLGIYVSDVKKIVLWGSERDLFKGGIGVKAKIINWLTNTTFLNSFRMTEEDMTRYINRINSYKPDLIRGYAGSLYELCKYSEKNNNEVYTPKILLAQAETVTDEMREKIENVFGTKLYNYYGSREVSCLAGECEKGLMHMFMFYNYIEILDDNDQPVKEGEEGRVIVTNLHNYSMPFIRYEIGDMAVLGPEKCACGNMLPTLKKVTGRITDHFVKEDGTIIHGEFFTHLFYLKDWVKAFQIIQEDYNKIRILVVQVGEAADENQKKDIENKIKVVMGENCKIHWDFVKDIPGTKSGKYLYTKSLVWT